MGNFKEIRYEVDEKLFEHMKQEFELSIEQTREYVKGSTLSKNQLVMTQEFTLALINECINVYSGTGYGADEFVKYLEDTRETIMDIFK